MPYRIQNLGLGGILDQAIAISKDHFALLFTIMLLLWVPFSLIVGFVTLYSMPELPAEYTMEDVIRAQEAQADFWPFFSIVGIVQVLLVVPLTNAAVIQAVARIYLGQPVTAVEALQHGLRRLLPLIGTSILMMLAIFGGFLLLIIPGVLFALWFGLAQHVVVLEDTSGAKALGRSKQLVRKHLGTFLMLGMVMFIISFCVGFGANFIPQPHLRVIISSLLQAVATVLWTAAGTVFYFSCRCDVDNFDLHYLAEAIGASPATLDDRGDFGQLSS
jgi:hypothetical protein